MPLIFLFIFILLSLPPSLNSQQPYEGQAMSDCNNQHNSTSLLGYFCNGQSPSCQSYLTFHSQPSYNSPSTISTLLSSTPSQISQSNLVSQDSTFSLNTKLLVPLNCTCSGPYYQSNTSYQVQTGDTPFLIANNTFQGLSTCQAIDFQATNHSANSLLPGDAINVPLRCACPTSSQASSGVKYLLSYLVDSGDILFNISQSFGVSVEEIQEANGISGSNIYPFTTLLIPLRTQPNVSQLTSSSSTPPTAVTQGKKGNRTGLYVGVGVGVFILFLLVASVALFFVLRSKKKKKKAAKSDAESFETSLGLSDAKKVSESVVSGISEIGHSLKVYKFEELQLATENFSSKSRIEGSVYRGVINGDFAAVKVMNRDVSKEIELLKKINHFNLVKLSGICFNKGQWYLVYEYADNGSLNHWISDASSSKILSWIQRVQIGADVANGLNYLHGYVEPPCVHKDIKTSNILIDERFRAKIANFSMARNTQENEEFALTKHIVGTQGYLAPEYLEHGLISPKLDVYAFGVVMLEMISGKSGVDAKRDLFSFDGLAREFYENGVSEDEAAEKLKSLIDPALKGDYSVESAMFMVRMILKCLQRDAGSRPSMEEIVQSMSKIFALSVGKDH